MVARSIALSSRSSSEAFCSISVCLEPRFAAGGFPPAADPPPRRPLAAIGDGNWRGGGGVAQRQHHGQLVAERHHAGGMLAACRILDRDHAGEPTVGDDRR